MTTITDRETILDLLRDEGERLLAELDKSDFFAAPASRTHHLAFKGGLALHSLRTMQTLEMLVKEFGIEIPRRSVVVCGLLHDICKANYYVKEQAWRKDARGQWESYIRWATKDTYPIGHGEKSVIILQSLGVPLTLEEQLAIRWHMGAWAAPDYNSQQALSAAQEFHPFVTAMHLADMASTHIIERGMAA